MTLCKDPDRLVCNTEFQFHCNLLVQLSVLVLYYYYNGFTLQVIFEKLILSYNFHVHSKLSDQKKHIFKKSGLWVQSGGGVVGFC